MAEYLVIRLGRTLAEAAEWIAVDDSGTRRSQAGSGSLEQAALDVGGRPVIVLVPATDVLTTSVVVPVRSGARLRAALPFAPCPRRSCVAAAPPGRAGVRVRSHGSDPSLSAGRGRRMSAQNAPEPYWER